MKHLILPPPITVFHADFHGLDALNRHTDEFRSMFYAVSGHVPIADKLAYDVGNISEILGNGWHKLDYAHLLLPENVLEIYLVDPEMGGNYDLDYNVRRLREAGWQDRTSPKRKTPLLAWATA